MKRFRIDLPALFARLKAVNKYRASGVVVLGAIFLLGLLAFLQGVALHANVPFVLGMFLAGVELFAASREGK